MISLESFTIWGDLGSWWAHRGALSWNEEGLLCGMNVRVWWGWGIPHPPPTPDHRMIFACHTAPS